MIRSEATASLLPTSPVQPTCVDEAVVPIANGHVYLDETHTGLEGGKLLSRLDAIRVGRASGSGLLRPAGRQHRR
jgi:hypothetical protein